MNIAIATDEKFSRYAYVLLVSIFENNRNERVTIFLMHRDLSVGTLEMFKSLGEKYDKEIKVIQITEDTLPSNLPHTEKWTIETYFRLALPHILSPEIDRVLYLDVDTICCKSLVELFNTDFEGKSLCMCRDMSDGNLNESQKALFSEMLEDKDFIYHNAGVVLMNISNMRKKYELENYFEIIRNNSEILTALDQDLLNYAFFKDIKTIDTDKYNLFARVYFNSGIGYEQIKNADVHIVHYTGPKPWSAINLRTNVERLWWEYAKLTPFYYDMLEELVLSEIDSSYISTNEIKMLNYRIQDLEQEVESVKNLNSQLQNILAENKALLEKIIGQ